MLFCVESLVIMESIIVNFPQENSVGIDVPLVPDGMAKIFISDMLKVIVVHSMVCIVFM